MQGIAKGIYAEAISLANGSIVSGKKCNTVFYIYKYGIVAMATKSIRQPYKIDGGYIGAYQRASNCGVAYHVVWTPVKIACANCSQLQGINITDKRIVNCC